MAPAASEPDDGFQLGDAIKWLLFLVPWSVFSLYCLLALSAQLGLVGVVEAVALALVSLPFWRRVCRRPVYLPYTALLRRHLAKSADSAGFEDTSAAGLDANPDLGWVKTVEERTEAMQEELRAFLRSTACRTPEDDFVENDVADAAADDDAWRLDRVNSDTGAAGSVRSDGGGGGGRMPRSGSFASRFDRRPSRRLARAGWSSLPLCDDTLVEPNAMAKRHFPKDHANDSVRRRVPAEALGPIPRRLAAQSFKRCERRVPPDPRGSRRRRRHAPGGRRRGRT